MICIGPYRVDAAAPIPLTTFVRQQLGSGMSIDDASWNALAEEIWNADTNAHLRAVARDSAVAGDASAGNLLLLADEWIYLPAAPPPPYSLQQVWVEAGESDAALIKDVLSDASSKGLNIPGDAITIDQLHEVVFNSLLRAPSSSNIPQPAYYYTVPVVSTIVDAVPTTSGAALMNPAFGTPPWLPTLWHWIDKLHDALDVLETAIEHLEDLKGAGQIAVAILTKMVKFLDAYQKIDKDEGISGMGPFQAQVKNVRSAIANGVVSPDAPLPQAKTVEDAFAAVERIVNTQTFLDAYAEFDAARDRYPATSHALDIATARFLVCEAHTPGKGDDGARTTVQVLQTLKPADGTVVGQQLASTLSALKAFAGGIANPITALVGNTPGPSTVAVAVLKIVTFWKLVNEEPFGDIAAATNKVFLWIAAAQAPSFRASSISELADMFKANPTLAATLRRRVQGWEAVSKSQTGTKLTLLVGVFDLVALINALNSTVVDWNDQNAAWYSVPQDVVQGVSSVFSAVGTAARLLEASERAGTWAACAAWAGAVVGGAVVVSAIFDVARAIDSQNPDPKKKLYLLDAAASVMTGIQPLLPVLLSRFGPKLCQPAGAAIARIALTSAARTAASEGAAAAFAGVEMAGETGVVLIGIDAIATFVSGVGGLILVGLMVYRNWDAIAAETAPRPERMCREWLEGIEASQMYQAGPAAVKSAMADCKTALGNAHFAAINGTVAGVHDALMNAGLDEGDIDRLVDRPDPNMSGGGYGG